MAFPMIRSASPVRSHDLGDYEAVLLDDIVSAGLVQYRYVMPVFRKGEERPVLFITSEVNLFPGGGTGTHFLCAFEGGKHLNFGASNAWGDLAHFETAALEKVRERLHLRPDESVH